MASRTQPHPHGGRLLPARTLPLAVQLPAAGRLPGHDPIRDRDLPRDERGAVLGGQLQPEHRPGREPAGGAAAGAEARQGAESGADHGEIRQPRER